MIEVLFSDWACERRRGWFAAGTRWLFATLAIPAILFSSVATAADAPSGPRPDAGSLLNQNLPPSLEPTLPSSTLPALSDEESEAAGDSSQSIQVTRFVIEGAKLLPTAQLEALLADLVGQQLNLAGLRKAAARITRAYREQGYFLARAYLPAQDIENGVVHIAIFEGQYDGVEAAGSARLEQRHIQGILDANQVSQGQSIERNSLERSLFLMEQRSGAPVQALLQPGATVGTSHMVIEAPPGPLLNGQLGADNYGNRYSGETRATGSLNLNSPRGIGDRVSLWLMRSSDSDAVFAAYQTPIGYNGFTLGASYSDFNYSLCCEFSSLDQKGSATVFGLQGRYPLILTQRAIMNAGLSLERKRLRDTSAVGELDNKRANVGTFSLDGLVAGARGKNRYQVALSAGDLDLSNNAQSRQADAATLDTQGRYLKLRAEFEHIHPLVNGHQINIRLSGQASDRNLDSSEDFLLGGIYGVRAYPVGEAAGDQGVLGQVDYLIPLRFEQLPGQMTARLFVDSGAIWINRNLRGGRADPGVRNHYALSGAGFGLGWALPKGFSLNMYVASAIGSNPGQSSSGDNADGRSNRTRAWLGAGWAF